MRRSKTEIYLHFVWATRGRAPRLTQELWQTVRTAGARELRALSCTLIALEGTADHVHLLVRVPGSVSAALLAKQVKGGSSHDINECIDETDAFRWQDGLRRL